MTDTMRIFFVVVSSNINAHLPSSVSAFTTVGRREMFLLHTQEVKYAKKGEKMKKKKDNHANCIVI